MPMAVGELKDALTTYKSGMNTTSPQKNRKTDVSVRYRISAAQCGGPAARIQNACGFGLRHAFPPPYQRLVSPTRLATRFARQIKTRLQTELNSPSAVEYEYCISWSPRL